MKRREQFFIEYRPTRATKDRPWVILMDAHPKPLTVGRARSEDEAKEACRVVGLTMASRRAVASLDGFESDDPS